MRDAVTAAGLAVWRLTPHRDGTITWVPGRLDRTDDTAGDAPDDRPHEETSTQPTAASGTWTWTETDPPDPTGDRPVGIWTPPMLDAHTHLGDAFLRPERDNLPRDLSALVAPPHGIKHRRLAETDPATIGAALGARTRAMTEHGTAHAFDFREGGAAGLALLRAHTDPALAVDAFARPAAPATAAQDWLDELDGLFAADAAGLGLSGLGDLPPVLTEAAADACRRIGRPLALHLAERVHEPMETALTLDPRMLVHLVRTTPAELREAAADDVLAVSCPTSNRFFGTRPPVDRLAAASHDHGLAVAFGTDNAMLGDGDLRDEAVLACRLAPEARLDWLLGALTWVPWRQLGRDPSRGPLGAGLFWPTGRIEQAPDKVTLRDAARLFVRDTPASGPLRLDRVDGPLPWRIV